MHLSLTHSIKFNCSVFVAITAMIVGYGSLVLAHRGLSPARSGAYSVTLVDARGRQLKTYHHRGRTYVLGSQGSRYRTRVQNRSGRRIEAVISVDGRDVLDGRPANWAKRGYVIPAWGRVTVDGFRLSMKKVATFRFSSVPDSYAARMGSTREVGVIGVAVFSERRYRRRDYLARSGKRSSSRPMPDNLGDAAPAPRSSASAGAGGSSSLGRRRRAHEGQRSGLGTRFGERRASRVTEVRFRRARRHPKVVLALRYNDRSGLLALGIGLDPYHRYSELRRRETARPFANVSRRQFATPPPGY